MPELKETVENHPIAVWVLIMSSLVFLLINALMLRDILMPHQYFGAQEFANEYIAVLEEQDDDDDGINKSFHLVYTLSMEYPT